MKYLCIKKDIIATLTYFNLFDYPLRKREIFIFLGHCDDFHEFEMALNKLAGESVIYKIGEFYSLQNNYALSERRYKGNEKAASMLKKAEQAANIISAFPFVKGVAVSGSLSKHFADENADIDFFIITEANRLWIARTFLHLFKKLTFLFNKQDNFCMNYFIDEAEPGILEKNLYTATEIATILPLHGARAFGIFYTVNDWARVFLPNKYMDASHAKEIKRTWYKYIAEKIFSNRLGNSLDNFLMKLTAGRWDSKTRLKRKDSKGFLLGMHTGKHFAKPNPEHFQKKLLQRYENSLNEIFNRYELSKFY
jgi:predicted nucleotidyltransferase